MRSRISPGEWRPDGSHQQFTDLSNVQTVTAPNDDAIEIFLQVTGQNVRATFGATNPTPTKGFRLVAGAEPYTFAIQNGERLNLIAESAGAVVEAQIGRFYVPAEF